jgi:hypothetical protein
LLGCTEDLLEGESNKAGLKKAIHSNKKGLEASPSTQAQNFY